MGLAKAVEAGKLVMLVTWSKKTVQMCAFEECMFVLFGQADSASESIVMKSISEAENMTDRMAALTAARDAVYASFNDLLAQFENQWSLVVLLMDKWLALQHLG